MVEGGCFKYYTYRGSFNGDRLLTCEIKAFFSLFRLLSAGALYCCPHVYCTPYLYYYYYYYSHSRLRTLLSACNYYSSLVIRNVPLRAGMQSQES